MSAPDTGQARETGADWAARPRRFTPEDTLSVAERLGAAEPSGGTVQAPDAAAPDLDRWLYETFTRHGTAARWARLDADDRAYWTRKAAEVRALLGTDTTPEAGRG